MSKKNSKEHMKRAIVIRWRKEKNLCLKCGLNEHKDDCKETYEASDMRFYKEKKSSKLSKKDFEKQKKTILSYRKKKKLCLKCGCERHVGNCEEDWEKSDNRTEEEKNRRSAIIPTPKIKSPSILEKLETKRIIDVYVKPEKEIKLHRDFVVLNLSKSNNGNIIEFNCINQLSKRLSNYIICVTEEIEKYFIYADVLKIKKLTNITEIKPRDQQTISNHICSSRKLYTFPDSVYAALCIKYNIPFFEFQEGKNATCFLPLDAYSLEE